MVLLAVKTSLPNRLYDHRREENKKEGTRTGELILLFGFVFVAVVVTMAVIGPQIAQLVATSAGL